MSHNGQTLEFDSDIRFPLPSHKENAMNFLKKNSMSRALVMPIVLLDKVSKC